MSTVADVNVDDITKISSGIILGLVVIGGILFLAISAMLVRLVIVIVVIGLGIAIWLQREHVTSEISKKECNLNATYFGFHLDAPNSVKQACAQQK